MSFSITVIKKDFHGVFFTSVFPNQRDGNLDWPDYKNQIGVISIPMYKT